MDDRRPVLTLPRPDRETRDVPTVGPAWTPRPDEHDRWRERVIEDVRPLVERCRRLRERGLLE